MLELINVSKEYFGPEGQPTPVLREINLTVNAGESVAILGPSGSGKSTLLNLIGGLDQPSGGIIKVDGQDLARLGENELARLRNRRLGYIFQLHHLLPQCSALENVLIPALAGGNGNLSVARSRAQQLLDRVGLKTRMGYRPGQLSGGERQRVAVARALINQPRFVMADEPTGSLDHDSAQSMAELLMELNHRHGIGLLLVTHALDLARRMDKMFEIRDGRLQPLTAEVRA